MVRVWALTNGVQRSMADVKLERDRTRSGSLNEAGHQRREGSSVRKKLWECERKNVPRVRTEGSDGGMDHVSPAVGRGLYATEPAA